MREGSPGPQLEHDPEGDRQSLPATPAPQHGMHRRTKGKGSHVLGTTSGEGAGRSLAIGRVPAQHSGPGGGSQLIGGQRQPWNRHNQLLLSTLSRT